MPSLLFSSGFMQNNSSSNTAIGRMFNVGGAEFNQSTSRSSFFPGQSDGGVTWAVGRLQIMKGTMPTNLSTITSFSQRSSDVLVTFISGTPGGGNFSPAMSTYFQNPAVLNTVYSAATAAGTATWFWITTRQTTLDPIFQQIAGTVGVTGSGADLEIASTTINLGQQIRVQNLRFVLPTVYTY